MSTTTLTRQMDGDAGAGAKVASSASSAGAGSSRRCRPHCCVSRRVGAMLVGTASLAILAASMTATVFGIVSAPDTPSSRAPSSLTGANFRTGEGRKRSSGTTKNVGGIPSEGGLRDPASGGGAMPPEPETSEDQAEDGPALIVVSPRAKGGTSGRLVGAAGGGQLFFQPGEDNRPVYIIRPAGGGGGGGDSGSVIVTSPGETIAMERIAQTEDGIIVELDFNKETDTGTGTGGGGGGNTSSSDSSSSSRIETSGQLTDTDANDSNSTSNSTSSAPPSSTPSPMEPPPLTEHLWLRAERGPLAVALALQIVFFVLTVLMLHGVRKRREDLVLLWLVSAAFGLAVGSAGAVLSALSAFDVGTPGAMLVGFAYLFGLALFWCGWAVVVAYHRQNTPPTVDRSHPHFG